MVRAPLMPWEDWLGLVGDPARAMSIHVFGRSTVPADWGFARRTVPEHLIYLLIEGAIDATAGGIRARLEPWSLLWLPPGIEHTYRAARRPLTLYHLRFLMVEAPTATPRREPLALHGCRELVPMVARMYDEHLARLPLREQAFRASLVQALCWISRAAATRAAAGSGLDERRRQRLGELVDQRLGRGLSAVAMAAAVGLSHAHFTRLFTQTYGVAPRTWLMHERVRRAAQALLDGEARIGDVAAAHGFSDIFLFSRQFSRVMGMSPTIWRRSGGSPRR